MSTTHLQKIFFIALAFLMQGLSYAQERQKVDIQSGYLEIDPQFPDAVIYTRDPANQVYIIHEGIEMWCDKAFVYLNDNFVKAFGNVRLTQADTISMTSKYAEYDGNTLFALAIGQVVLTEPNSNLKTDTLYFDRKKQEAYYRSGGTVRDTASILTSKIGRYFANTKKYRFIRDVNVKNPDYTITAPQLDFYSETGAAFLYGRSVIKSETSTVYCERGFYDTRGNTGYFVKNSRIDYDDRTIYGDSIYFDRNRGFASATNNIKVIDTINNSIIRGHYAEVFRKKDSVFITKRAVAVMERDQDSLYIHADTLRVTGKPENRIIRGFYDVRLFKSDMSGKSDSIHVNQKSGLTQLLGKPILWNGGNQMTGDTIHLISNKITEQLDSLKVFDHAFLIQKDSLGTGYNQVKGKILIGLFTENELDTVHIIKNSEVIFYPRDDEDKLIGINNTVSSAIEIYLKAKKITGIKFLKKVPGKIYPESEFPENARKLTGFNWRGDERLLSIKDLFKGQDPPVLPKIKGIVLPKEEEDEFQEDPKKNNN